ncbi:BA14K family protein [Amorphus coralli]|uniref:BA14K family protein n=1 Tax=Amorphus coralli TaxID=340680 RepID=UPI000415C047|nr:BA14K family protein [Amorphus coralli]
MKHRAFVIAAAAAAFSSVALSGPATAFPAIAELAAPSSVVQAQYTRQGSSGSNTFVVGPNNLRGDRPSNGGNYDRPRPDNRPDENRAERRRNDGNRHDGRRAERRYDDRYDRRRYYDDRRNWRGPRRYHDGRYWRPADDGWYVYNDGAWIAAGALGLAAGALLGSAITTPQAPATVQSGAPVTKTGIPPWTPAWYTYCSRKFKSFNPETGLYLGYDGKYHYCR